jgi:hypothetical protein
MTEFERGYKQGKVELERELALETIHPGVYDDGFKDGYTQALEDFLNDEANSPLVVQAREWYDKKAHNADR